MKSAMRTAHGVAEISPDADVLKIFMAPEFYWRGRLGAYPIEQVADIMDLLREEAQQKEFKDWIFVYGTAIGFFKHGDGVIGKTHQLFIKTVATWDDSGTQRPLLTVTADPSLTGAQALSAKVCARIPQHAAGVLRWSAEQAGAPAKKSDVLRTEFVSETEYKLYLHTPQVFAQGAFTLSEPSATETFNLALIQRGGQPVSGGGLSEAIVYKEFISHIDFLGGNGGTFHDRTGVGRTAEIHGVTQRVILPTSGSTDVLGATPNTPGENGITEVSRSGLGGGSLFTMDGISFGVEVCRDHCVDRLQSYFDKSARPGEPKPQIHLIPSWGMDIDGGSICAVKDGLVFNVDGPSKSAAGVLGGPEFRCPTHPMALKTKAGVCAQVDFHECRRHGHFNPSGGQCPWCPNLLQTTPRFDCAYGAHLYPAGTLTCPHCTAPTLTSYQCSACGGNNPVSGQCSACGPKPTVQVQLCFVQHWFYIPGLCCTRPLVDKSSHYCGSHYQRSNVSGPCPVCAQAMTPGHHKLKQVWTPMLSLSDTPVPELTEDVVFASVTKAALASKQTVVLERTGEITVYPVKAIPPAETL